MRQIIKKFPRRYMLVALLFVAVAAVGLLLYRQQPNAGNSIDVPPSKVIVTQAEVTAQGVQLAWLEAQPGAHPVTGYIIGKSRSGDGFERVARVEGAFLDYLDADGMAGDSYRIIAEDGSGGLSPVSEPIVATAAKPGSAVVTAPDAPRVLGVSSALEQAGTPEQKAEVLQSLINQLFEDFDATLNGNDNAAGRNILNSLQIYQRQALSLWPQLPPSQKQSLAQICADRLDVFEANLHALPEDSRLDGLLALAGCQAIQEAAQS